MSVDWVKVGDWVELKNYVYDDGCPLVGRVVEIWTEPGVDDDALWTRIRDTRGHTAPYRLDMIERFLDPVEALTLLARVEEPGGRRRR